MDDLRFFPQFGRILTLVPSFTHTIAKRSFPLSRSVTPPLNPPKTNPFVVETGSAVDMTFPDLITTLFSGSPLYPPSANGPLFSFLEKHDFPQPIKHYPKKWPFGACVPDLFFPPLSLAQTPMLPSHFEINECPIQRRNLSPPYTQPNFPKKVYTPFFVLSQRISSKVKNPSFPLSDYSRNLPLSTSLYPFSFRNRQPSGGSS